MVKQAVITDVDSLLNSGLEYNLPEPESTMPSTAAVLFQHVPAQHELRRVQWASKKWSGLRLDSESLRLERPGYT